METGTLSAGTQRADNGSCLKQLKGNNSPLLKYAAIACFNGGIFMNKADQIKERQKYILKLLAKIPEGQIEFKELTTKLNESGYAVNERTVRNDCNSLVKQELAGKTKKGVAITPKGLDSLKSNSAPEEKLKEKYLKQMAILKNLYSRVRDGRCAGLSTREVTSIAGLGSEDAVKELLQGLAEQGLVVQEGGNWRLGSEFSIPVSAGREEATLLFEYLNVVSGLAPLPPGLSSLAGKLVPAVVMPDRDTWREEMAKVASRIIVHGRGTVEPEDGKQVIALVEESAARCLSVTAQYRGREIKLYPLGAVYHWEKRQWYIISLAPPNNQISEYRADRLTNVKAGNEFFEKPAGFNLKDHLARRWGISSGAEYNVSVKFQDTDWHKSALDKLRGDISRRQVYNPQCHLEPQPDKSWILQDRVSGLPEFAAWIRSYGDAAVVLSPEKLRRKMGDTAKKMLERYCVTGGAGLC
jgi:predicted DNA-binding transcriptional regulator YafY